jgi:hypothetical protein
MLKKYWKKHRMYIIKSNLFAATQQKKEHNKRNGNKLKAIF